MKKFVIFSLLILTISAVFAISIPKREYSMVQCGYMSQSQAETGAGYASAAAWYLGATTVSTHSYEMGPGCHGCPTEFCFQIHWTAPDPELNASSINELIRTAIDKAAHIKDKVELGKYLEQIKKDIKNLQL